ncbi:MAG: hypothetical protein PHH16_02225 [Candidatus Gracilibacteria bacterium]|nr:hypothetical protein [Candidatus Gracilibacteria bacterium]
MLQAKIYKNERTENGFLSSRKIETSNGALLLLQISFHDAKLGSFIENTIIDLILTNSVAMESDAYSHFGYLLERLNKYFKEIEKESDFESLSIFIGIVQDSTLHFSILKNAFTYLLKGGKIMNIAEGMGLSEKVPQFSYISSGAIGPDDTLCISNTNVLDHLTEEDMFEMLPKAALGGGDEKRHSREENNHVIENLLSREIRDIPTDLILLYNPEKIAKRSTLNWDTTALEKVLSTIKQQGGKLYATCKENEHVLHFIEEAKKRIDFNNRYIRSGFFGLGAIVCIGLLYLILGSIFTQQANTTIPEEYKNKLIEAQLIIEKSNKDMGNRDVFNANIKKAEDIIFEVRKKQVFLNDVKKLLGDISILKKQMNGVESFDPKTSPSEYLFEGNGFGVNGIFEISKKLYFIGKTSIIGPYVKGGEVKKYNYPDGEEAVSSDVNPDGYVYIFTKTGRLLSFYKGEFAYVNVEGQKTWEKGKTIKFYNSNLYVLAEDGKQIYKHKPGVNGFGSKTEVLDPADTKNHTILTFGIDGGFYILKEDLTVDKIFGLPNYTKRSIRINNLPENYTLDDQETPDFFNAPNLNYLYLVLSNKIWIFEPDTKNYKDVKAIKYIGQIEFVEGKIGSITVPKDGTIIAATDTGVYTVNFEVSDGKVIVR